MRPCLVLLAALALVLGSVQSYEYGYEYGYDGLYGDDAVYDYLDDYGYYSDDGDLYYEEYGYYSGDDLWGYDDYYDEYYDYYDDVDTVKDCTVDKDGKVKLANGTAPCDIKIEGVDKQADLLPGGLDGVYKLYKCNDGRPAYKRVKSPAGQDRVLFYSKDFGDWDVAKGTEPNEDILMYGGELEHHSVPLFAKNWHLGADLTKAGAKLADDQYMPISATLKCADGKVYKPPAVNSAVQKQGPILTDEEIEAKYKLVYDRYGRRPEPNPTVNFSFVIMLVMVGLAIVLAIPYMLVKQRGEKKGYQPVATSFAQVIQQSKKKQSGHVH
ncbi:hypothetical protein OEZ86_014678 [Tetradesmus obliquus]|nr:hypothetical protein OEZ86_014678 [Tetradesmus obliquus]